MGRPVKRDIQGTLVFGTYAGDEAGIKVSAFIPGESGAADAYVLKQAGSRTYKVVLASDDTVTGKCKLVAVASAEGEMVMTGEAPSGTVRIARLLKRTAYDFSGNRYSWILVNDSSADYIELTPIA